MKYNIVISDNAASDLIHIYNYIAFKLYSPGSAAKLICKLREMMYGLDQMPMRFRAYPDEPWHSKGFRIMPVDNYVVIYSIDEEISTVNIVRVIYGGRNIDEQL